MPPSGQPMTPIPLSDQAPAWVKSVREVERGGKPCETELLREGKHYIGGMVGLS